MRQSWKSTRQIEIRSTGSAVIFVQNSWFIQHFSKTVEWIKLLLIHKKLQLDFYRKMLIFYFCFYHIASMGPLKGYKKVGLKCYVSKRFSYTFLLTINFEHMKQIPHENLIYQLSTEILKHNINYLSDWLYENHQYLYTSSMHVQWKPIPTLASLFVT